MINYQKLTITLIFPNAEEYDLTDLLVPDSFQETFKLCNDDKCSVLNTISFSIHYNQVTFLRIIQEQGQIAITVIDSDTTDYIFTGVLDPVASLSAKNHVDVENVTIEAVDSSADLDRLIEEDISWPATVGGAALTVYDPDNLADSILYKILVLAGWEARIDQSAPAILETIKHVSLASGERNYRELLDTILSERLYVLDTTREGKLIWKAWTHTSFTEAITEDDILVSPPLKLSRKYVVEDGIKVISSNAEIVENARLWEGSLPIGEADDPFPGEPIGPGEYWPEGSDTEEIWQEYSNEWLDVPYNEGRSTKENDDLSLIATSDWEIRDSKDAEVALDEISAGVTVDYRCKRARLRYKNNDAGIEKLYYSRIYGKALIRTIKRDSKVPSGAAKYKPVTTWFIFTKGMADRLAAALYADQQYGDINYSFSSFSMFETGEAITIKHEGLDIETNLIIISRALQRGAKKAYSYQAIGVSELDTSIVVHQNRQGSGKGLQVPLQLHTQYSADGATDWHTVPVSTDYYLRSSSDGGHTWSESILFRGADGEDGADGANGNDGTPAPQYLGVSTNAPVNPNDKDFFLYSGSTGGGYTLGKYYQYQTDEWVEVTDSYFLMAGFKDALNLALTQPSIYASTAVINLLMAQQLTLTKYLRIINDDGSKEFVKFWRENSTGKMYVGNGVTGDSKRAIEFDGSDVSVTGNLNATKVNINQQAFASGDTLFYGNNSTEYSDLGSNLVMSFDALTTGSVRLKASVKAYYFSSSVFAYPTVIIKINGTQEYSSGEITNTSDWTDISQNISFSYHDIIEFLINVRTGGYGGQCSYRQYGFFFDKTFDANDLFNVLQRERISES